MGALLPIAIRMLQQEERGEATREAATLYALNTAGGLLGAGLANHYLVPLIGIQGTIICLASICAAVGVINRITSYNVCYTKLLRFLHNLFAFSLNPVRSIMPRQLFRS